MSSPGEHRPPPGCVLTLVLGPQDVQSVLQVARVRRGQVKPLARCRMREAEPDGMQPLPLQGQPGGHRGVGAVGEVTTHGWRSAAMCTRIWWVRPVSSTMSSSVAATERLDRVVVGHARSPPATTAQRASWLG